MNPLARWQALRKEDAETANRIAWLFVLGGLVPVSLIVFSAGWAQWIKDTPKGPMMMATAHAFASNYMYVYIVAIIAAIMLTRKLAAKLPNLGRCITMGAVAGAIATLALDGLRMIGVVKGWLPMDTPILFGTVILGPGSDPDAIYTVGLLYHILNGASFGLLYGLIWGHQETNRDALKAGIGMLLVVELGMMTLPPMQPMVGSFGLDHSWPNLFLITLAAHIAFGAVMALIVQATARPIHTPNDEVTA